MSAAGLHLAGLGGGTTYERRQKRCPSRPAETVGRRHEPVFGFLVLALGLYFIITQPEAAADTAQSIGVTLRHAADSITTFFSELL